MNTKHSTAALVWASFSAGLLASFPAVATGPAGDAVSPSVTASADGEPGLTDSRPGDGDYEIAPLIDVSRIDTVLGLADSRPGQADYQIRPLVRSADCAQGALIHAARDSGGESARC